MTKKSQESTLQLSLTRLTRTIYFFIGFYALSIVIFDSGNLITREAVADRWTLASILLIVNTAIWFLAARTSQKDHISSHSLLAATLSISLIIFAGYMTYWERGMASTSTILYVLPVLVIATLKNRHALLAVTTLSAGTYGLVAVKYFNDFFNEGYRVQLWGSMLFYMGTIFVSAWLIMVITGLRHDSN